MNEIDVVQAISLVECVLTIPVWYVIGRANRRVGLWSSIPILISLSTAIYYALVIFTNLNELYVEWFKIASALLRLYVHSVLLFGGLLMYRRYKRMANRE